MANLLHWTRFTSPNPAANPFTVTIPATTAGSTIVVIAGGIANIQAKLGVGGTNFTLRDSSSTANMQIIAQDIVDSTGGTTQIQFSLFSAQNVDGIIFEFAAGSLGAYISGAHSESGTASSGQASTGSVTTTGAAVLFGMFGAIDSTTTATRQWWGFDPLGKQFSNAYVNTDATKTAYFSMIGVSDQTSAGTFTGQSSRWVSSTAGQCGLWAYEDLSGGAPTYAYPYTNAIEAENSLSGVLSGWWFGASTNANIAGYTDTLSYNLGDTVNFKIDSNNTGFNVEISRIGYYGYESFGAKLKTTIAGTPAAQPAPTVDTYGGSVCNWSTTATWSIPTDATPGIYMYNMRRTDNSAYVAQGIFVVKSAKPSSKQTGKIMMKTADFTWQAYNQWGATSDAGGSMSGRCVYGGGTLNAGGTAFTNRAFGVSYDRPFGTVSQNVETYFWDSEMGLVNFLEGNGYDIDYYTCVDIEKDTSIPSLYEIAVSNGHDEYWSANLRDAFENARDNGTNLFFTSSNTSLWHVRFDSTDTNKRRMIVYKDSANTVGWDGTTKYDPVSYTGTWRDPRTVNGGVNNTSRRPESSMSGQWFVANALISQPIAVPAKYNSLPIWRNTSVATPPSITYRGATTASLGSAGTSMSITPVASTQVGDLVVVAMTFNGDIGSTPGGIFQRVQYRSMNGPQATLLGYYYAQSAGATAVGLSWSTGRLATAVVATYGNAVWNDAVAGVAIDTSGSTAHTTMSLAPDDTDRWAICTFADINTTGTNPTTSWTAGAGLTLRASTDNTVNGTAPYLSLALADSGGPVSQTAQSYAATANFAQTNAHAGLFFLSPGKTLYQQTMGAECDYPRPDEPSTPANMVMLSDQLLPLTGNGANYNGYPYSDWGVFKTGMTLYQANSGALVFNSGTWRYTWGISRFRNGQAQVNSAIDTIMQQATINVIRDMGVTPTSILTTTQNNDPTALVDPGSAYAASAYGLPANIKSKYQNIFGSTPPTAVLSNDLTDYTLGTLFSADTDGYIYGIRWYFPGSLPNGSVIGLLYSFTSNTAGTELARVTINGTSSGWQEITFASPVAISANASYVAAVWTQDNYVGYAGEFAASGLTLGHLTAPKDSSTAHNGKYIAGVGSPAYPTSSYNSGSYMIDVMYLPGSPGGQIEFWGQPMS